MRMQTNQAEDDLPIQTQILASAETFSPVAEATTSLYFKNRFSIYRKGSTPFLSSAPNQLSLFKSFSKCKKSIDPQAQILPICTDHQMHSLSTTDQINQITEVGIRNYFKSYKPIKKTLSGDFHIGSKLTFNELKHHKILTYMATILY